MNSKFVAVEKDASERGARDVARAVWTALLLGSLALLQNGCVAPLVYAGAGAAAGVGTYAYVNGELKMTEQVSLDKAWSASQAAIKELEFAVLSSQKDALTAKLISRTAGDKKIQIALAKKGEQLTEIRIRAGTFGDESLSRLVFDKIKKRL